MSQSDEGVFDPTDALAVVAQSRARMAERLYTPSWYHPLLGLSAAMVGLGLGLVDPYRWVGLALMVAGVLVEVAIVLLYRRITGVTIGMAQGQRGQRLLLITGVAAIALMVVGFLLMLLGSWRVPVSVVYVVCCIVIITALGRRYDAALRDEIRAGVSL